MPIGGAVSLDNASQISANLWQAIGPHAWITSRERGPLGWALARTSNEAAITEDAGEPYDQLLRLVGRRIKECRRAAGLKQHELAAAIGATQPYIVAVEAGENLTLRSLARISAILEVHPTALLREAETGKASGARIPSHVGNLAQNALDASRQLTMSLTELRDALPTKRGSKSG